MIDALLRVKLPQGPGWYRYNGDGYGEHEDGSPFDGTGIGRPWPLLAGERAHYELAAGRVTSAEALLGVMENSTGATRLIPEQVWDTADIPERELFAGKAIRLGVSAGVGPLRIHQAAPVAARWKDFRSAAANGGALSGEIKYRPHTSTGASTTRHALCPAERSCGILLMEPAMVHWSFDNWQTTRQRLRRERMESSAPGSADRNSPRRPTDHFHVPLEKQRAGKDKTTR